MDRDKHGTRGSKSKLYTRDKVQKGLRVHTVTPPNVIPGWHTLVGHITIRQALYAAHPEQRRTVNDTTAQIVPIKIIFQKL